MPFRPKQIAISRQRSLLIIDWADGHHSEYPLPGLRSACPCAECRGGHENMGQEGSPDMLEIPLVSTSATELVSAAAVGNYALQLTWGDGHDYGIYTWDYLRALCPCGEHGAARNSGEPSA
jgi:DUF971 family protein